MKGNGPPPPQPEAVDAAIKSILSADSSDFVSALDRFTWTFGKGDFFHWVRRGGPPALGIAPVCSMRGARACSRIPSLASLPRAQTALFDHLGADRLKISKQLAELCYLQLTQLERRRAQKMCINIQIPC